MQTKTTTRVLLFATLTALSQACGGSGGLGQPEEGNAYLTIVGDQNVFLDVGTQTQLSVRYHDANGQALAGQVDFEIVGDPRGSSISRTSGVTGAEGLVQLNAIAGGESAAFRVRASAAYAASVEWSIAVEDSSLPPLEPQGTYRLDSRFDVSDLPGDVGKVISEFIKITEGPNAPATWILDQLGPQLPSWLESLMNTTRPYLDMVVNEVILNYAPGFVEEILEIGDLIGQAARRFGTITELGVAALDGIEGEEGYGASHTLTGFVFRIDGETFTYSVADLGSEPPVVDAVSFSMSHDEVTVGEHDMPVPYGGFLALAVNEAIIPMIDPYAANLTEFLQDQINCSGIGEQPPRR